MKTFIVVIGILIKVWLSNGCVYVQPNNRYTWVEYDNIHYNLEVKEVFVYSGDKLTIGVN